ncbi:MAG: multidrug resistance efflux transporter family protein [Coriobacteriia bacterium]|nr:multidrug resistance efflux transporter family protein [Coriobacteriia bacterium]
MGIKSTKARAILLGIAGSFFFAFTFILNRTMNLTGGYWMYSAILRYAFTLPILFALLVRGRQYLPVLRDIKAKAPQWIIWSTVGFGLFYLPLTMASLYAESWFVCAMWQVTIVAGVLLTPLFGKRVPIKNLACSCLIVLGIFIMQLPRLMSGDGGSLEAFLLILVGAFSYPLGNRKTMAFCDEGLSTIQRIFGMTLCSMPFWLACTVVAWGNAGLPSAGQCMQALAVAVFSGVIATVLFFKATDLVKNDPRTLAAVEATQCGEVIFTLLLAIVFLKDGAPGLAGWIGIGVIVAGMTLASLVRK